MAVVVFDPVAFKLKFPEFVAVSDPQLQFNFDMACLFLDNTDASPVQDVNIRATLLDLLTAHITQLNLNVQAGNGVVGRLSSASEGGVSSSFEYSSSISSSMAWYIQTPYGAMYWQATTGYRRFKWVEPTLIPAWAKRGY